MSAPSDDEPEGDLDSQPWLKRWRGQKVGHLTVDPKGTAWVIRHGCHERLHRFVLGDFNPVEALSDPSEELFEGTKVELALVGWVQLQSDDMTDRIHVDAPDGFEDSSVVRRFARATRANTAHLTFYPSMDQQRVSNPARMHLRRDGARVPVVSPRDPVVDSNSHDQSREVERS